jgi:catechol 2,3-dioxygenase-like lactoylglutathione lyase family enzyme
MQRAIRPSLTQQVTFLYTADLEATHAFYGKLLGLPLVLDQDACRIYRAVPGGAGEAFLGFCRRGAVLQPPAPEPAGQEGVLDRSVVLTLVSEEVDGWGAWLEAQGVALERPPQHNATYNIRHLFLRDPDNRLVEIQQFLDPTWPQPGV